MRKLLMLSAAAALALTASLSLAPVAARQTSAPAAKIEHRRVLPLQGGQNFRDLGGYRTADGRIVKWGTIYRSGAMHRLTTDDFRYLASAGLKTVVDLRSTSERSKEAVAWPEGMKPEVHSKDYELDSRTLFASLAKPGLTGAEVKATMARFYRDVPITFADQYSVIFAEILAGDTPLAFNCSAGKDRTGVASALLLIALGVPRETAIEDYLLSNTYFKPDVAAADPKDPQVAFFARLPAEARQALMGVDRSYLEAALATVDAYPGGPEAYYREKLGMDVASIAKLRDKLLVRQPAA